jgi:hypothetical protein
MFRLLEYYGRWQGFKSRTQQLPAWARFMLVIAAIPGVLLISLSLLALLVSIVALLLLTLPTLRIVTLLSGGSKGQSVQRAAGVPYDRDVFVEPAGASAGPATTVVEPAPEEARTPRRQIEVKIVE